MPKQSWGPSTRAEGLGGGQAPAAAVHGHSAPQGQRRLEQGKPEQRQCWCGGGRGVRLGMPIWLCVPSGLDKREGLMPGRKVPLLCSTQGADQIFLVFQKPLDVERRSFYCFESCEGAGEE